jgi:hypothetical protein
MLNKSLRQARNINGIVGKILEFHQHDLGNNCACVLVEDLNDKRIFMDFFNERLVEFFDCNGRENLQRALEIVVVKVKNVIGIRDADFCHLEKISPHVKNLFFTDFHDIEMSILSFSEVRRKIFVDFLALDDMNVIWEAVLRLASFMGYIRWYNEKNDCGISFGGLFSNDGINISQNDHQAIIDKLNFRAKTKITEDIISVFIDNNKTDDVFNLCNGHDVSTLLTLAVKTNEREFKSALYASFHSYLFAQTKLFQNILEWQTIYGFNILMT